MAKKNRSIIGVTTVDLKLREEPDAESDILYVIPKGKPVIIIEDGSTEEFYKVNIEGLVGYCVKKFISM